jgi:hypothetical protein
MVTEDGSAVRAFGVEERWPGFVTGRARLTRIPTARPTTTCCESALVGSCTALPHSNANGQLVENARRESDRGLVSFMNLDHDFVENPITPSPHHPITPSPQPALRLLPEPGSHFFGCAGAESCDAAGGSLSELTAKTPEEEKRVGMAFARGETARRETARSGYRRVGAERGEILG